MTDTVNFLNKGWRVGAITLLSILVVGLGLIISLKPVMADASPSPTPADTHITIVATNIICDSEKVLPNWGNGAPDITADTATNWLAQHSDHCSLGSGWYFQWVQEDFVNWTHFGPTDSNGVAKVDLDLAHISGPNIYVKEELQSGYVPFSPYGDSAEFYCHNDGMLYDNLENIFYPSGGNTYYCVAFNAKEAVPSPSPSPVQSPLPSPSPVLVTTASVPTSTPTQTPTPTPTNGQTESTQAAVSSAPETGIGFLGEVGMFSTAPLGFALSKFGKSKFELKEELGEIANRIVAKRLRSV